MLKTVKVTGVAYKQDGTPASGSQGSARLSVAEIDNGVVVPRTYTFCVEDNGYFEFNAWPNERGTAGSYYYVSIYDKTNKVFDAYITIPDVDYIVDIADRVTQTPLDDAQQAVKDARDAAQESKESAQQSEDSAGNSADSASDAKDSEEASAISADTASKKANEAAQSATQASESEGNAASSATAAAKSAQEAEDNAASVDASVVPLPNRVPKSNDDGLLDDGWLNLEPLRVQVLNDLYPYGIYPSLDLRFAGANRINNPDVSFSRASKATYWDKYGVLREADIDEPRFTYDPVTGEALGLLSEPFTSTNLLLNSEVVADQTITVPSGDITLSFYGEGEISFTGAATGTLQGTGGNARSSITVTAVVGELVLTVTEGSPSLGQLEAGTRATSYIPTEGSQATRAGDLFTLPVGDWYRPDLGTLVVTSATPEGELVTKLGEIEGFSNSNENRLYRATYIITNNATELELGVGTFKSIQYYDRVLSRDPTTTV